MKKRLLGFLAGIALFALSACSGGASAVKGKSFTFKECTSETMITGTAEQFYEKNNQAGTTKEDMLNSITKQFYYNGKNYGTSLNFTDELGLTGYSFNGSTVTCYTLNYYKVDDWSSSNNGYYITNGDKITLVVYDIASDSLKENNVFKLGSYSYGTTSKSASYVTTMTVTSITYSDNLLTTVSDVTYKNTLNDVTITSTCEFTITWEAK